MKNTLRFSLLLLPLVLASCGGSNATSSAIQISVEGWEDETTTYVKRYVKTTEIVEREHCFHTPLQEAYLQSSWEMVGKFACGEGELSLPNVTKIDISAENAKTYIEISTSETFDTSRVFKVNDENTVGFYNFLLNTNYYWRVGDSLDFEKCEVHSFKTDALPPRNIKLDGVTNVRDLGGYESKLGGTIRQGLYYRGGAITHGSTAPASLMTDAGYKTFTQIMGVKTEIDLRMTVDVGGTPENNHMDDSFFPEVTYHSIPIDYHVDNMMTGRKEQIRDVFKIYGNKDSYPVYVHCSIGTDRTGCISYIMGVLLGMKYENLYRDYLFSNFGNIGGSRDETAPLMYQNTLMSYRKKTLAECAEAYLLDIGVSQNEIDTIREVMIEK